MVCFHARENPAQDFSERVRCPSRVAYFHARENPARDLSLHSTCRVEEEEQEGEVSTSMLQVSFMTIMPVVSHFHEKVHSRVAFFHAREHPAIGL